MEVARTVLPLEVVYAGSAYQAADKADAVVLMTEWPEFRRLDLGRIARRLKAPIVVDLRNFYEPQDVIVRGLEYHGIGQASCRPPRQAEPRKMTGARAVRTNGHQNGKGAAVQLSQSAAVKWARREQSDDKKDAGRPVVMEISRSS